MRISKVHSLYKLKKLVMVSTKECKQVNSELVRFIG
jgi:hypothetical protein